MKRKSKQLPLAILAWLCWTSPGWGLTQLGNGDLVLEGQLDYIYDSNVFIRNAAELDDSLAVLFAGASFLQQERSVLNVEARLGVQVTRFFDFSEEDSEDLKSSFRISYPNHVESRSFFEVSGGYNEATQADEDVGQRLEVSIAELEGLGRFDLSDKVSLELSATGQERDYTRVRDPFSNASLSNDAEMLTLRATPAYRYSEKLFFTGLVQLRDLNYSGPASVDQQGVVLAAGARGQLLPKVDGAIFVGVQDIDLDSPLLEGSQSRTDPFYSVDVVWTPREGTTVTLSGSSNFQSSVLGDVNNREDISLDLTEQLSFKSTVTAGVTYSNNDYEGFFQRTDQGLSLNAGYSYSLNERMGINLRVSYIDRASDITIEDITGIDVLSFDKFQSSIGFNAVW